MQRYFINPPLNVSPWNNYKVPIYAINMMTGEIVCLIDSFWGDVKHEDRWSRERIRPYCDRAIISGIYTDLDIPYNYKFSIPMLTKKYFDKLNQRFDDDYFNELKKRVTFLSSMISELEYLPFILKEDIQIQVDPIYSSYEVRSIIDKIIISSKDNSNDRDFKMYEYNPGQLIKCMDYGYREITGTEAGEVLDIYIKYLEERYDAKGMYSIKVRDWYRDGHPARIVVDNAPECLKVNFFDYIVETEKIVEQTREQSRKKWSSFLLKRSKRNGNKRFDKKS